MKKILLIAICFAFFASNETKAQEAPEVDKSVLDMAYYPSMAPFSVFSENERFKDNPEVAPAKMRIIYSRPMRNERAIFGELVKYGEVWRLGANENAEATLIQDLKIGGKNVPNGRWGVFAIPGEKEWTLIFSSLVDTWGAYGYNEEKDVVRTTGTVSTLETPQEAFSVYFKGDNLHIAWDTTLVTFSVE